MRYALVLAAAICAAPADAQEIGNAGRGKAYALERCAKCHAIDKQTEYSPVPSAPHFETVANTRGMTGMAITVWMHTSHRTMPDLVVKGEDLDDLIAYIQTLKRPPDQEK